MGPYVLPLRKHKWQGRDPNFWKTGSADMTQRQRRYLGWLSLARGFYFPFLWRADMNNQRVTKRQASELLTMLEELDDQTLRREVTAKYVDSLGREPPYEPPGHPLRWANCHTAMSSDQRAYLQQLCAQLEIPSAASQAALRLTRGQASWLIDILVEEKDVESNQRFEDGGAWFTAAMRETRLDVPLPGDAGYDKALARAAAESEAAGAEVSFVDDFVQVKVEEGIKTEESPQAEGVSLT